MSWYLDIVSKNWDGIIVDDYEIVFPIIFKKIFFLKNILSSIILPTTRVFL